MAAGITDRPKQTRLTILHLLRWKSSMSLAKRLAAYTATLNYAQLDEKTIHEVRRRLIDSLACAAGAYRADAPRVGRAIARRVTAEPGASFLGGRGRPAPSWRRL
jgi:2-methylcitrate dehydratase